MMLSRCCDMKIQLYYLLMNRMLFAALVCWGALTSAFSMSRTEGYTPPAEVVVPNMKDLRPEDKPYLKSITLTGHLTTTGNSDFRQLRDLSFQVERVDLRQAVCSAIPDNAFHSRPYLRSVILPQGVTKIGSQAFFGCRRLERIVIPASVEEIGEGAFNGCTLLREVVFEGAPPRKIGKFAFNGVPVSSLESLSDNGLLADEAAIIPIPAVVEHGKGSPLLTTAIGRIVAAPALHNEAAHARRILKERAGLELLKGRAEIRLELDTTLRGDEAYTLNVDRRGVCIKGRTAAGVFYGLMTFEQLLVSHPRRLQPIYVADAPRTKIREFMVDPCRTFIPFEELKQFVVEMARYKMNALHLHLVDDQAWRIEIKKYPRLLALSSTRPSMDDMLYSSPGFYTQDEMKELVAFAAKYHVMVIPEIEMPGHEVAAIHAYPQLTPGAKRVPVRTTCGVSNELLNPASEFTYEFLFNVFDELAEVFPAPYVHLGGDEAGIPPLDCWTNDSSCVALKKRLGIKTEDGSENWRLQKYMFDRVIAHLRDKLGKTPMFWYETDFKEIQPGCVVFAWRHGLTNAAIDAAIRNKAKIMLCPGEHCYLDYPMQRGDMPEVNWGMPVTTLKASYDLEPSWGRDADFEQNNLYGVAGTLWSECINTPERIYYQAYPRGLALAEAGWSLRTRRNYDDFLRRLKIIQNDMMRRGISVSLKY